MNIQLEQIKMLVLADVNAERERQNELWGVQRHPMSQWLKILVEEVGEVAQAMQSGDVCYKNSDADDLYKELIQVAAVSCAMAEQLKDEHESGQVDKDYMIFRIVGVTRWNEDALKNMTYEKVEQIYKDSIKRGE